MKDQDQKRFTTEDTENSEVIRSRKIYQEEHKGKDQKFMLFKFRHPHPRLRNSLLTRFLNLCELCVLCGKCP